MEHEFVAFAKIGRLSRDVIVTEKIDGTNAQIFIGEDGAFLTGSRSRWITPEQDNFGFARWANDNKEELLKLGPGRHFGEWWGQGIQRRYGMTEKVFSLFNTSRWGFKEEPPSCCRVVPVIYNGPFDIARIDNALDVLAKYGSKAAPGFMDSEGIIVYHVAGNTFFKKTIKDDETPKSLAPGTKVGE